MLESVKQYLQDWSDACEYANECAPDLSVFGNGEPFTALIFVAAACYLIWAFNEARIHRRAEALSGAAGESHSELRNVVEQMKQGRGAAEKLAA
jgi:hypothetical protein